MATLYTRTFNLKGSLNDKEVLKYWKFLMEKFGPSLRKVNGVQSVKFYSGAGALRGDLTLLIEMDNAGIYDRILLDSKVRKLLGQFYGDIDLKTSGQSFRREVTDDVIRALSSTGWEDFFYLIKWYNNIFINNFVFILP